MRDANEHDHHAVYRESPSQAHGAVVPLARHNNQSIDPGGIRKQTRFAMQRLRESAPAPGPCFDLVGSVLLLLPLGVHGIHTALAWPFAPQPHLFAMSKALLTIPDAVPLLMRPRPRVPDVDLPVIVSDI